MTRTVPVDVVVVGTRRLWRELTAAALDLSGQAICVVAQIERVEEAAPPADVVVLSLTDGSGLAVVPACDLTSWSGERPEAVSATVTKWTAEPEDLGMLVVHTAAGTLPVPSVSTARIESLTSREVEVLGLLGAGWEPGGIAEELGISENTLRTHQRRINAKLDVHSRLEAAAVARQLGMVTVRRRQA